MVGRRIPQQPTALTDKYKKDNIGMTTEEVKKYIDKSVLCWLAVSKKCTTHK
jgi:hypothetical protein